MSKSQFQIEYEEYTKYKQWQEMLCCKNAEEVIDFVMSNYLTEDEKCRTIANQDQQISDLEAKLKESEKDKQFYFFENGEKGLKIRELKKQLAESENQCRECKHLNKKIELNIKNKLMAENCELQKQLAEKDLKIIELETKLNLKDKGTNV